MRHYKHLTRTDRLKIETLYNQKYRIMEIAKIIRVHESTIYRELKRGKYIKLSSELKEYESYSSDLAQQRYENNLLAKGVGIKLGKDYELANYLERKIGEEKYSPAAALGEIKAKKLQFKTTICVSSLYSYIEKNVFLTVTNDNLSIKSKRKRKYKRVRSRMHKNLVGESIEKRDDYILTREEFGHWEMDTVKGKISSKSSLLVLTERKTRKEIIVKLKKHSAEEVVKAMNDLEIKYKSSFKEIFKTITVDNGKEFSYSTLIEQSILSKNNKRTNLYYCHPYTSWERGTNEVTNKLIRRFIPKFTCFDKIHLEEIDRIENWINNYPRKIHNYSTAEEMFMNEINMLPKPHT